MTIVTDRDRLGDSFMLSLESVAYKHNTTINSYSSIEDDGSRVWEFDAMLNLPHQVLSMAHHSPNVALADLDEKLSTLSS